MRILCVVFILSTSTSTGHQTACCKRPLRFRIILEQQKVCKQQKNYGEHCKYTCSLISVTDLGRSQKPCRLMRTPAAGSFLGVAGLNPPEGSDCCLGSGRCESCRMYLIVCDHETSTLRRPRPDMAAAARKIKY